MTTNIIHNIPMTALLLQVLCVPLGSGIWLPPHEVNLQQDEEFVISELLDRSDVQDVYDEEELIKEDYFKLKTDQENHPDKYYMLHAQAGKYNEQFKRATFDKQPYGDNVVEFNPHLDEEIPYVAGFVGKDGELIKESEFYLDDDAKSNKTLSAKRLQKRGEYDNDSLSYDYEGFKAEYEQEIKEMAKKNDTLKYSEIKEEETPNEAVKTLIDFSAKNCTSDDLKSMSINSARCLWLEMKKPHFDKRERLNLLEKLAKLVAIWFIIYLLIALPLWCQYGWCCCCCRCKFCRPLEQIDEVKTFFENNPVGVFRDETGKVFAYEPTDYEKYAQKKLQKAIYSL